MASDHSTQGNASQMPKRIRDITKMKATQHRIVGNAILPEASKASTMKCMKLVPQSRGLDQLDFTPPLKHHQTQPTWIELKSV
jgi:hypothetical protein